MCRQRLGYAGEFADSMSAPALLQSDCFSAVYGHGMRHVLWPTCKVYRDVTQKVQLRILGCQYSLLAQELLCQSG